MRIQVTATLVAIAMTGLLLVACGKPEAEAPTWQEIGIADVEEGARAQIGKADAAREALIHDMFELLGKVLTEEETPRLEICGPEAEAVAKKVAADKAVKIGRTSFRLRNAKNVPPEWATTYVADRVEDEKYLRHADGRVAALFPLRMQKSCVTCHGDLAEIDEDVKALIAQNYPDDKAVDFPYTGLRGYIWVEVPAP